MTGCLMCGRVANDPLSAVCSYCGEPRPLPSFKFEIPTTVSQEAESSTREAAPSVAIAFDRKVVAQAASAPSASSAGRTYPRRTRRRIIAGSLTVSACLAAASLAAHRRAGSDSPPPSSPTPTPLNRPVGAP